MEENKPKPKPTLVTDRPRTEGRTGSAPYGGGYQQRRPYQQNYQNKKRMYYRRKVCKICQQKESDNIDYKNIQLLRRFVTEKGKIIPRRLNGTCARHQRAVNKAIKQARTIAFLPFTEI